MALFVTVLLYVIVSQLTLIPEKSEIRKLTDKYRVLMEETSMLTDEEVEGFKIAGALEAEETRLKNELSKYFVKNSGYINDAARLLIDNIEKQIDGFERVAKRDDAKKTQDDNTIDKNIANSTVTYTYTVSGKYMDFSNEKMEEVKGANQQLYITISFKKVDGKWGIYRVSQAMWTGLSNDMWGR